MSVIKGKTDDLQSSLFMCDGFSAIYLPAPSRILKPIHVKRTDQNGGFVKIRGGKQIILDVRKVK